MPPPHVELRAGQEKMADAIMEAVSSGKNIAVEAPSGFGKTTVAVSVAARLSLAKGFSCIYAVRTKREMDGVLVEARRATGSGVVRVAPLLSMTDACTLRRMEMAHVPQELLSSYCRGSVLSGRCPFYDPLAGLEKLSPWTSPDVDSFIKECDSVRVCPYYKSRALAMGSDITVTTYPHVLMPQLRSDFESRAQSWRRKVVIFDEAHNLPQALYSSLTREVRHSELRLVMADAMKVGVDVGYSLASKLSSFLLSLGLREGEDQVIQPESLLSVGFRGDLDAFLRAFSHRAAMLYEAGPLDLGRIAKLRLLEYVSSLSQAVSRKDSRIFVRAETDDIVMAVKFLDVAAEFAKVMQSYWSAVFLSATFFNYQAFSRALGMDRNMVFYRELNDPLRRVCVTLIDGAVSTEYSRRDKGLYLDIASRLSSFLRAFPGRTALFFPSYEVMEATWAVLKTMTKDETVIVEDRYMSVKQQAEAVRELTRADRATLLGVMGGRYSEGEDFDEGRLDNVAIVGLPLSPPSKELSVRLAYSAQAGGSGGGYEALVIAPAVSKVVQAAGRLFRRKGQSGVVLLMDRRFRRRNIMEMLPPWIKECMEPVDLSDREAISALASRLSQRRFSLGGAEANHA